MINKDITAHWINFCSLRVVFIVCLLLTGAVQSACAQFFTIEDYRANIVINENGTVDVTETIEVVFDQSRHGIYREIPYRYVNKLGDRIVMPLTVKSVLRKDGKPWNYKVSRQGNVINIRIGDAGRYVQGRQVYVIRYLVENAILFFDDHDELYWNVTGNYWRAPILHASADILLNTEKDIPGATGGCFTGRYGSSESKCSFEISGNKGSFSTTESLRVKEGFTVALGWDKGIVSPPSSWQRFLWAVNLRENWVFLIPVVVLLFMLFQWYTKGRDPKVRESIVVKYKPPEVDGVPLTPAQVGVLVDERLDKRDVTASMIGLAVKGYIALHEVEPDSKLLSMLLSKDYRIVKLKQSDDQLSQFEQTLMEDIFPGGSNEVTVSELKNEFYRKLPNLRKILFEELVDRKFFAVNPLKVKGRYGLIGFAVLIAGSFILYHLLPLAPWKGVVAGFISGFSIILLANAMPAKTRSGALARMDILGFQEFMKRADKDRLERMGESIFYKYLPYAISLGVVDHWMKSFEGLLSKPPNWYVPMAGAGSFSTHDFTQSLNVATSHLGSTMFSAPRGSGSSGGGGFSGGGGGGGGGGSW